MPPALETWSLNSKLGVLTRLPGKSTYDFFFLAVLLRHGSAFSFWRLSEQAMSL